MVNKLEPNEGDVLLPLNMVTQLKLEELYHQEIDNIYVTYLDKVLFKVGRITYHDGKYLLIKSGRHEDNATQEVLSGMFSSPRCMGKNSMFDALVFYIKEWYWTPMLPENINVKAELNFTLQYKPDKGNNVFRVTREMAVRNGFDIKPIVDWPDISSIYDLNQIDQQAFTLPVDDVPMFVDGETKEVLALVQKYQLQELHQFLNDVSNGDLHEHIAFR